MKVSYPKNRPNQTCDYWLTHQTSKHSVLKLISFNSRPGNCKTVGSYKITPLTVQCRLHIDQSCDYSKNQIPITMFYLKTNKIIRHKRSKKLLITKIISISTKFTDQRILKIGQVVIAKP